MAWRSHGSCNADLIAQLEHNEVFSHHRVKEAMMAVDRADFCVDPSQAYMDRPLPIGHGATISAPHMHAKSLELLRDHMTEGSRVLDVGSGSGYLTVCIAMMMGMSGKVVGIDHIKDLVDWSVENVGKHHQDMLDSGRVILVRGDGRAGYPSLAPYNAIHVGAAAPHMPQALIEQLANGGRMVIPVGEHAFDQEFNQVDKDAEGRVTVKTLFGVRYVPLTDEQLQLNSR